jgi:hypothetical protein
MKQLKIVGLFILINNYKEFKGQISGIKSINKSGLFITFKNESPLMYQGVDTLETDLKYKNYYWRWWFIFTTTTISI